VWTGSEMIVWGGCNGVAGCHNFFDTGGRYNPSTDSWTATSTTNAPAPRYLHTGVWSGGEMIIWGGYNNSITFNTGGRYNPSTDSWTATSTTGTPTSRSGHTAVWTDSEMIVWGGISGTVFNTGGRYNPSTDSWTATSTTGAPDGREDHVAVWTGSEMVVWCGTNNSVDFNTGGRYNPSTDSWTATSTTNAPRARYVPGSVWTGTEMIAWGGIVVGGLLLDTGGRYCVQSGSPITLDFRLKTQGAKHQVNLQWSPADGGDMNILRNGAVVATVPDNGQAKSSLGTHTGTFTYQVCETDSGDCSNEVTVNVP